MPEQRRYNRSMTDKKVLTEAYRQARKRLLLLDYDGTLVGFDPDLTAAKPTLRLRRVLGKLTKDPRNTVVIISGRDRKTLESWLQGLPVHLVAEHGYFVRSATGDWRTPTPVDDSWKSVVLPAMDASTTAVPGSFIEEKTTALVWHYRGAKQQQAAEAQAQMLARTLLPVARSHRLAVMPGSKVIEVKSKNINKGSAAKLLLGELSGDFVMAAGDDTTDEDMFKAVPSDAFTIKVGPGRTAAQNRVPSYTRFLDLLESLSAS